MTISFRTTATKGTSASLRLEPEALMQVAPNAATVTATEGEKATMTLEAVPDTETLP